jgi:hypothetical protein
LDSTVSKEQGSGDNPFTTSLDEQSAHALVDLQRHGQVVGIMSNRAAGQIVRRCEEAGFEQPPLVVGTYRYELKTPAGGSVIDLRFWPYCDVITGVLRSVRNGFVSAYGLAAAEFHEVETTTPTAQGPIYLEIKGQSEEYPEGLAQEYNLNRIPPWERVSRAAQQERLMRTALAGHAASQIERLLNL